MVAEKGNISHFAFCASSVLRFVLQTICILRFALCFEVGGSFGRVNVFCSRKIHRYKTETDFKLSRSGIESHGL